MSSIFGKRSIVVCEVCAGEGEIEIDGAVIDCWNCEGNGMVVTDIEFSVIEDPFFGAGIIDLKPKGLGSDE